MSRKKNEKRLDELISRTINSGKPEFDVEKWKQKYPEEFQMLQSMSAEKTRTRRPSIWWAVCQSPITKLAAAAVIIVAVGLFIVHQRPSEQADTTIVSKATKSPAEMQATLSLSIAYRRGGIEAVDRQCQKAIEMLGPRPAEITIQQILTEFNGT
jgi:hypothetical protein